LVEIEYNAGKAMLVRLNQVQQEYNLAAGMLAQARVNLQRSWQALHAATGVNLTILSQGDVKTDHDAAQAPSDVPDHE
jgi:outer membrane protein TolC